MKKILVTDRLHILSLLMLGGTYSSRDLAHTDYIKTSLSNQDWSFEGVSEAITIIIHDLYRRGYCTRNVNIYGNDLKWQITMRGRAYYLANKNEKFFSRSTSSLSYPRLRAGRRFREPSWH